MATMTFLLLLFLASSLPNCSAVKLAASQEAALLTIKSAWRGSQPLSSWKPGADCGTWAGISCNSKGMVTSFYIGDGEASGSIPPAIGNLTALTQFIISPVKRLSGALPSTLSRLRSLQVLWLGDAYTGGLTGPVPSYLGTFTALTILSLRGNRLTGPIPAELARLSHVEWLSLAHIRLSGSVPGQLSSLAALTWLELSYNLFTGSIPPSLSAIKGLEKLELTHNRLSGPLPVNAILGLKRLDTLTLGFNRFTGSSTTSLAALVRHPRLSELDLGWNRLYGGIPTQLGAMSNLASLILDGNGLAGRVPAELFAGKPSLARVSLAFNHFSGEFPWSAVKGAPNIAYLLLNSNLFVGSIPGQAFETVHVAAFNISHNFFSGHLPNMWFTGGEEEPLIDFRYNYFWGGPEFRMMNMTFCPEEGQADPSSGDDEYMAAFNCLGKTATCQMKSQRTASACTNFCGASAKTPPCSGHGVCVPTAGIPPSVFVCVCDNGYQLQPGGKHACQRKRS